MNVNWPTFIISLSIGLFIVYITATPPKVVFVYPTPENISRIQFKDKAGHCHAFKTTEVPCKGNTKSVHEIPIQNK